ncbi:2Fe-2S iron-sulfur cluster binding domain-containing protein [Halopseudomonas aestusnigri]|jgi:3-phenylpropionate/trans-cinnamate dioxygenase ferredoxin reductase subunit|uniref:2Fe-2S iron-sulfur cluster-binding protein n=1 Tax=Halopseudomonas TaxID=2901189 RepID=UPI000C970096|nr:2Fe-2S iron-sulfur cluster binding domain-containing protein [Halopseudomonas aestusnigri]MAG99882.1 oxidoreductase [Pseudomonadales bacterium]MEE2799954.1 2Fe-2S iron-sulfur cluster binding domain-containing protein [Pseudomonadota bacterium]HBT58690.1 oxidoreductase [Pseudomonas sp.]MAP75858.1 oxidoreductase [Pseudomonadales bacterium]MAS66155.1 oxidoreductase [Pseudomonadales bacterium]|tara:strand:+ start:2876 stop:3910 length:1035 start_codon:yes stop_codon:yes gene_type:complete
MFSLFRKKTPVLARINGEPVAVQPGETLLHAALRHGIDFPHGCRVGGCASCKCRLVSGQVRELTETGYILSDEELDAGFILACQSEPRGEVEIEVDLAAQQARQRVRGRVVEQQPLTHDITRLVVQLEQSLPYKAGQYADLSFDLLPQHARSFSFATRQQPDAQVSFFIRKVQGGVLTSAVHSRALVGESVTLEGPLGDFYLRPARAPLLLVAGGSGLAPILALLEEALATGGERPVTLLFGARAERDLYALEQINSLAGQWNASFNFVPVLSDAALDASWRGVRGQVTELIGQYLAGGSHAYLCGPPGMIDSAIRVLLNAGVAREHIYFDRFTTLPAPVTASA